MSTTDVIAMKSTKKQKERSFWGDVFLQLQKNKMAMASLIILILLVLASIFVPIISPFDIITTNTDNVRQAPDAVHWLGTDDLGRDMLTRFFYAGRISLSIALSATVLTCIVGVVLGGISGYYGGIMDSIIMRITEAFLSIPFLLACIAVAGLIGNSIPTLISIFTILSWAGLARIVRGQILGLRDLEYMQACEALGISDARRIFKHLLPNVMAYVIVFATINMAGIILTEAALSFLGLGVNPPTPTWGNMIQAARARAVLQERWWYWIPPGIAIFVAVMCFNLLGDGLRDAIDPKMKR